MKRCFCRLNYLCILILLALPLAARTVRIYVVNFAGTTIDVIDPATNTVVQVIEGIEGPLAVHFSPDGSRLYITAFQEDVLNVIDRKTGKYIKKIPLSGHGDDLAVTEDGRLAVVTIANITGSDDIGALDIIDTTSLEKVKTIPVEKGLHDVVVTPDSKYAIAGSSGGRGGETATVFDLQGKKIAWEIQFGRGVGVQPLAIESNPDGSGRRIFLQLHGFVGFAVVDFATHQEVTRIRLPDEPSGFEKESNPSHGIGLAPDGKTLWVNSNPANAVFVYSLPELKLLGHVSLPVLKLPGHPPIGSIPNWLTFTPDSKTVYVTNSTIKLVSAIDTKTMKVVAEIPVGERPVRISTLVLPGEDLDAPIISLAKAAVGTSDAPAPSGAQSPGSPAQAASGSPQPLDYEFFKARVEPIFLKERSPNHARCYVCHEKTQHLQGFRLEPLSPGSSFWTEEQSRRNFQVVSALVVPGKPLSGLFPNHPLAPEAGGDARRIHNGGRQFESQEDPDFQTLADWVRGQKTSGSSAR
jgi:YVTN family beta-propeller protein